MVSLKDIAERCKVSTATVSKALNGQKDVGENTRVRILAVADEMGYYPNSAARMLKTKHSNNIGVLFQEEAGSGLKHEYFSGVLNGFKTQAEFLGYDITFMNNYFGNKEMSYYDHCRYRNFDGVVIVCANYDDPGVVELMNSDIPVVTIDYIHHNCSAVNSNNGKGIEELVRYIYTFGHRKIAYIHGQKSSYVTKERLASFYRVAKELNLEIPEEYIREATYLETEKTAAQTRILLDMPVPPTCIIYPDDTSLIGGRNVIMEREMKIPDDVSVAGYDGILVSQLLHPQTTTIGQATDRIGKEAASRLIRFVEHPKTSLIEIVVIEGELIKGQSVGPVKE